VVVAKEERVETRTARGLGALDHPARAVARVRGVVVTRQ